MYGIPAFLRGVFWEEMESVVDKLIMLRFCMPLFCWQYIYILICKICKA